MNYFLTCLLLLGTVGLTAQYDEIEINNPSFEGIPHRGVPNDIGIRGWYDCGLILFKNQTPPDIHPLVEVEISDKRTTDFAVVRDTSYRPVWEVTKGPSDGKTYLGMVVRDNDSWESLSQRVAVPIEDGKCYNFDIELARSKHYVSGSRVTDQLENYTKPAVLRIWGGTGVCGKQELLGESVTVSNEDWRTYEFEFRPNRTVNYFTLEAFYKVPTLFPYNGHLLLDNASLIKEVPCDEEEIPTSEAQEVVATAPPRPRIPEKTAPAPITESLEVEDLEKDISSDEAKESPSKNLIPGLLGDKFTEGQLIRVNTIYFVADSTTIVEESEDALEQIYHFMARNKGLVIEVGGHTNTAPSTRNCDRLSKNRAKKVASYLASKGVSTKRLYYRGYGKRKPIMPNDKYDMDARKKNQRVEIKILQTDYQESD